jgi:hypothetical protein
MLILQISSLKIPLDDQLPNLGMQLSQAHGSGLLPHPSQHAAACSNCCFFHA